MTIISSLLKASCLTFSSLIICTPAWAQITPDGTLSTTVTTPDGSNFTIENGDRARGNLFHSFRDFSVPTNGSAFFNNAPDVQNIINRVTGGSVSNIDGLIGANGSANLFLINPAGIIFGPNASLSIGGSFFGSTADSLVFPEGEFSATDTQSPPLLTINAPIGLNFRDNPEDIAVNQSQVGLQVQPGQNLALIGGDINLEGGVILAPGGRVNLGGLSVAGEVGINSDGSLTFPDGIARADVSLINSTSVNVASNNGGAVTVNARNLEILNGSSIFAGIIPGNQQADAQAGDIVLNATDKVNIAGEINSTSAIGNIVGDLFGTDFSSSTPTRGNAGNILIDANLLEGTGSFVIGSVANGEGNAGNVTITGRQSVSLTGNGLFGGILSLVGPSALGKGADITITTPSLSISNTVGILASTLGQGNTGNIFINATDSISLNNGSQLQATTFSQGNAGNIVINAENADIALDNQSLFSTSVFLGASGQGGNINIKGNTLSLQNGSQLLTNTIGQATTGQLADAGNIKIDVFDSVNVGGGSLLVSSTSGQGNAGNVEINAGREVVFNGGSIRTRVEQLSEGLAVDFTQQRQGGNINITASSLSLANGAQLISSSLEQGDAGNVTVNANSILLDGQDSTTGFPSAIFSRVGDPNQSVIPVGNAGGIELNTNSLSVNNGAQLSASTSGEGNAGTITINDAETVSFDGGLAFSTVEATGVGTAGGINITTSNLSLTNGGQLLASTRGQGDAGNVTVNANNILLDGQNSTTGFPSGIFSQVGQSNQSVIPVGNAGGIELNTNSLSVNNGAALSASTYGEGNAGTITINDAETVSFDGGLAFSTVEATGVGTAGGINITTSNLSLTNGGQLLTVTRGQGDAGNVMVNANSILLDGQDSTTGFPSGIFSQVGDSNQSVIPVGNAGGIEINTNSLSVNNGAELNSSTYGEGNAGTITINDAETVAFDGGNVFSTVAVGAIGNAGGINLTAQNVLLNNSSELNTSSFGQGNAGSVRVNTNSLTLDNESSILASNTPSELLEGDLVGGNITLEIADNLILRNNSLISAAANNNANGGNINIDAGFVIAFPSQVSNNGNDIIASAERGRGGNINIDTQQIFGLQERRAVPGNGTNDIDASSEFGLSGQVVITNLVEEVNQGVVELPDNVVEPETLTAQACSGAGRVARGESSFTITGRGGLPALATDPLNSDQISIEGADAAQNSQKSSGGVVTITEQPNPPSSEEIVPARGMIVNEKGEIVLTAYPTPNASQRIPNNSASCGVRS